MSTKNKRAANAPGRKPAHQNTFKFKHNPSSKKTKYIKSLSHQGLCKRCYDQIEWRKTYRKYKPLKQPRKCNGCGQRVVRRAYHTLCDSCAGGRGVCAKCAKKPQREEGPSEEEQAAERAQWEAGLEGMSERQRRAMVRKREREEAKAKEEAKQAKKEAKADAMDIGSSDLDGDSRALEGDTTG